jgi:hypothetical protein
MTRIFISYRREDSAGYAGRLADALEQRYGAGSVFRDVDDIAPGEDFVQRLRKALDECHAMLPVIGRRWLSARGPNGAPRLADPDDFVRIEIATALERGLRLIPVLVDGAALPRADELPEALAALPRRQALVLTDSAWGQDLERLCAALDAAVPREQLSGARKRRPSRRTALLVLSTLALAAAGVWVVSRPADLAGRWQLADGSHWIVQQSGRELRIEDVHYESRQVWRQGSGRIAGDRVEVELRYVFHPEASLAGTLQLSRDTRSLSGTLRDAPSGRQVSIDLTR